jgi:hypothetical protein
MKATVRAELLAMGEIDATQDHKDPTTMGPLNRGILLECVTDDDVRAFASLLAEGVVTLNIHRVFEDDDIGPEALGRRALEDPLRGTAAAANRELAERSARHEEIAGLCTPPDRLSPVERAKLLAGYRKDLCGIVRSQGQVVLGAVCLDLVDNVIALIAAGER